MWRMNSAPRRSSSTRPIFVTEFGVTVPRSRTLGSVMREGTASHPPSRGGSWRRAVDSACVHVASSRPPSSPAWIQTKSWCPGYEYTFQLAGWGWLNIFTGLVLAAVAVAILAGATWARATAIIAGCLAIVVTFLWMPYYPTGSIVLIVLDVVAVWGVATWNTSGKSA